MRLSNNIITPTNADNYLVNTGLQLIGKEVRLGTVGHISDWAEVAPEDAENRVKEWAENED